MCFAGIKALGQRGNATFSFGSSPFSLGAPVWGLAILGVTLMGRGFYFCPSPVLIQIRFQNLPKSLFFFFFPCTRTEEAEGILDPKESEKLNFNEKCTRSPLLTQLWATAILGSLSGEELLEPGSCLWALLLGHTGDWCVWHRSLSSQ